MKYLLLLGIIVGIIWWLKLSRKMDASPPTPDATPQPMVRCLHCDLHLPSPDAIHTDQGAYCSLEHRDLQESRGV